MSSIIVIAPDSFKESLSAQKVAQCIAHSWKQLRPNDTVLIHPMADGGEGTMEAILSVLDGEKRITTVKNPLGQPVQAQWGWMPEEKMAIIEMAEASGLHLIAPEKRRIQDATTYGTGELVLAALDAGAKKIILTLGGSATNDVGAGMLEALGLRLLDAEKKPLPPGGAALARLAHIDLSQLDPRIKQTEFIVACDVNNPLCGATGASAIFGPQKGASIDDIEILDQALNHFADICCLTHELNSSDKRNAPGAGAAGGTGYAALTFFNATFRPGVALVAELTHLKKVLAQANLVITGEGRLDAQTLHGKTISGIIEFSKEHNIPVIAIAGEVGKGYEALYPHGLTAAFSIAGGPITLLEAQKNVETLLAQRAQDIARFYTCLKQQ